MPTFLRCLSVNLAIIACTVLSAPVSADLLTYTYTGNPFTSPDAATATNVSIWFTVDSSSVPKNSLVNLTGANLLSFNFSDGNPADFPLPYDGSSLEVAISFNTDASRNVTGQNWSAIASSVSYSGFRGENMKALIETLSNYNQDGVNTTTDISENIYTQPFYYPPPLQITLYGQVNNNPGTWSVAAVVPLPGAGVLFVSALGGFFFKRNRRLGLAS
jgi:hypothetical protein